MSRGPGAMQRECVLSFFHVDPRTCVGVEGREGETEALGSHLQSERQEGRLAGRGEGLARLLHNFCTPCLSPNGSLQVSVPCCLGLRFSFGCPSLCLSLGLRPPRSLGPPPPPHPLATSHNPVCQSVCVRVPPSSHVPRLPPSATLSVPHNPQRSW